MPKTPLSHRTLSLALAAAALTPLAASAAEPQPAQEGASSWGVGLAVITTQEGYAGKDRKNRVLPLLSYENDRVRLLGPLAEFKLGRVGAADGQQLDFRLVARYDFGGYDAGDAPVLAGMSERKGGVWVGGKVNWRSDWANLGAEWTADAASHSKGQRFGLSLERTWRVGPQLLAAPRLGATWLDRKTVDYYYGVRPSEAAPGRPTYAGASTVNAELSLRTTYLLDRQQSVYFDVGVTRLGSSIRNSPLVDRSTENRVLMGWLYRF